MAPHWSLTHPVVLVDSGSSVGESVFLERIRQWLHKVISDWVTDWNVPTIWIVYPNEVHRDHYGNYPVNEYDHWEIRPIRRRNRTLESGGMLATVAMFEDGCMWKKIKAPWREWNSKGRRANIVFLNPSKGDMRWGARHHETFKQAYNIPFFRVGSPLRYGLPPNALEWVDSIWAFSHRGKNLARKSAWPRFGDYLPWPKLWEPKPRTGKTAFLAHEWGDIGAQRQPELAKSWLPHDWKTLTCANSRSGADLLRATEADLYIVASTRESVPFDAMIAAARGATIVAPDRPIFRWIPGKKILFPAQDGGDHIVWNTTDAQLTLQHALKHGKHQADHPS